MVFGTRYRTEDVIWHPSARHCHDSEGLYPAENDLQRATHEMSYISVPDPNLNRNGSTYSHRDITNRRGCLHRTMLLDAAHVNGVVVEGMSSRYLIRVEISS